MYRLCPDDAVALESVLRGGILIADRGFGLFGVPEWPLEPIEPDGVRNLTCVSNNAKIGK